MDIQIDISDHPILTGIKRKAKYKSINISDEKQRVSLMVIVSHYNSNGEDISSTIKNVVVELVADNTSRVDANGVLIEQQYQLDGEGNIMYDESGDALETTAWVNGTPEWDFLDNIAKSGNLNIYGLIQNTMIQRSAAGRFDDIY